MSTGNGLLGLVEAGVLADLDRVLADVVREAARALPRTGTRLPEVSTAAIITPPSSDTFFSRPERYALPSVVLASAERYWA